MNGMKIRFRTGAKTKFTKKSFLKLIQIINKSLRNFNKIVVLVLIKRKALINVVKDGSAKAGSK